MCWLGGILRRRAGICASMMCWHKCAGTGVLCWKLLLGLTAGLIAVVAVAVVAVVVVAVVVVATAAAAVDNGALFFTLSAVAQPLSPLSHPVQVIQKASLLVTQRSPPSARPLIAAVSSRNQSKQSSAIPIDMIRYDSVCFLYYAMQCDTIRYDTIRFASRCDVIRCDTMRNWSVAIWNQSDVIRCWPCNVIM